MKTYQCALLAGIMFGAGLLIGHYPTRKAKSQPEHTDAAGEIVVNYPDHSTRRTVTLKAVRIRGPRQSFDAPHMQGVTGEIPVSAWMLVVDGVTYLAEPTNP